MRTTHKGKVSTSMPIRPGSLIGKCEGKIPLSLVEANELCVPALADVAIGMYAFAKKKNDPDADSDIMQCAPNMTLDPEEANVVVRIDQDSLLFYAIKELRPEDKVKWTYPRDTVRTWWTGDLSLVDAGAGGSRLVANRKFEAGDVVTCIDYETFPTVDAAVRDVWNYAKFRKESTVDSFDPYTLSDTSITASTTSELMHGLNSCIVPPRFRECVRLVQITTSEEVRRLALPILRDHIQDGSFKETLRGEMQEVVDMTRPFSPLANAALGGLASYAVVDGAGGGGGEGGANVSEETSKGASLLKASKTIPAGSKVEWACADLGRPPLTAVCGDESVLLLGSSPSKKKVLKKMLPYGELYTAFMWTGAGRKLVALMTTAGGLRIVAEFGLLALPPAAKRMRQNGYGGNRVDHSHWRLVGRYGESVRAPQGFEVGEHKLPARDIDEEQRVSLGILPQSTRYGVDETNRPASARRLTPLPRPENTFAFELVQSWATWNATTWKKDTQQQQHLDYSCLADVDALQSVFDVDFDQNERAHILAAVLGAYGATVPEADWHAFLQHTRRHLTPYLPDKRVHPPTKGFQFDSQARFPPTWVHSQSASRGMYPAKWTLHEKWTAAGTVCVYRQPLAYVARSTGERNNGLFAMKPFVPFEPLGPFSGVVLMDEDYKYLAKMKGRTSINAQFKRLLESYVIASQQEGPPRGQSAADAMVSGFLQDPLKEMQKYVISPGWPDATPASVPPSSDPFSGLLLTYGETSLNYPIGQLNDSLYVVNQAYGQWQDAGTKELKDQAINDFVDGLSKLTPVDEPTCIWMEVASPPEPNIPEEDAAYTLPFVKDSLGSRNILNSKTIRLGERMDAKQTSAAPIIFPIVAAIRHVEPHRELMCPYALSIAKLLANWAVGKKEIQKQPETLYTEHGLLPFKKALQNIDNDKIKQHIRDVLGDQTNLYKADIYDVFLSGIPLAHLYRGYDNPIRLCGDEGGQSWIARLAMCQGNPPMPLVITT